MVYNSKVVSWDLVNEAFENERTYQQSVCLQQLSIDQVTLAFEYGYEVNSLVILFYNDYGHEYSVVKRTAILNLVN